MAAAGPVGFIVTKLETPSQALVRVYNKRGTAEQWIEESRQAVNMTRLSCHRFRSNEVRLALSLRPTIWATGGEGGRAGGANRKFRFMIRIQSTKLNSTHAGQFQQWV